MRLIPFHRKYRMQGSRRVSIGIPPEPPILYLSLVALISCIGYKYVYSVAQYKLVRPVERGGAVRYLRLMVPSDSSNNNLTTKLAGVD